MTDEIARTCAQRSGQRARNSLFDSRLVPGVIDLSPSHCRCQQFWNPCAPALASSLLFFQNKKTTLYSCERLGTCRLPHTFHHLKHKRFSPVFITNYYSLLCVHNTASYSGSSLKVALKPGSETIPFFRINILIILR